MKTALEEERLETGPREAGRLEERRLAARTVEADRLGDPRRSGERLAGAVLPRGAIDAEDVDRLYDLFVRYYLHVDRATFDRDWNEKDWILLLRDDAGVLRGFTTMKLYDLVVSGRPLRAVFNGNTIIDQAYWGEQALVRTWCGFMAELKAKAPVVPLYWYLICSGYRTYLYLPLFFREFFPRHDRALPDFERELIDFLGGMKFPTEYRDGVVRVARERECLHRGLAVPPAAKMKHPHIRFFVERNRNYLRGDELVCIAEYSIKNTRRTARQALLERAALPC